MQRDAARGAGEVSVIRDVDTPYRGELCLCSEDRQTVGLAEVVDCRRAERGHELVFSAASLRRIVEMPVEDFIPGNPAPDGKTFAQVPDDDITPYPEHLEVDAKGLRMRGMKV